MRKYVIMWYDIEETKAVDIVEANNEEEARSKAYLKYNGKPPAPMISIQQGDSIK